MGLSGLQLKWFIVALIWRNVPKPAAAAAAAAFQDKGYENTSNVWWEQVPEPPESLPPPRVFHIELGPSLTPQHTFTMLNNQSEYRLRVSIPQIPPHLQAHRFKLSVVVEKIVCHGPGNFLVIQGSEEEGALGGSLKFCEEKDYTGNGFGTVERILDDVSWVGVRVEGDWTSPHALFAKLVATVYYEVEEGCAHCAPGYFCCGSKESCSSSSSRASGYQAARCIPERGNLGGENLRCNNHPNCGFFCNADEGDEVCGAGASCFPDCGSAIRLTLLVIFCLASPPLLILLLCRLQGTRRFWGRVGGELAQVFGGRVGVGVGGCGCVRSRSEEAHAQSASCCQHRAGGPPADYLPPPPPPPYESVANATSERPPTFAQAMLDAQREIERCRCGEEINEAFVPEEVPRRHQT